MLVQVHDEIVISVPTEELNVWEPVVEEHMGNGRVIMGVRLEVEAHHAGSWSEAKG
jgi:DNA polymerase I-like protein with 3'-5' exonuclease and polymerase domains